MSWTNWRAKARTCSTPSLSGPSCPAPGSSLWVSMQDVALLPWSTLPLLGGSMGTSLCSPLLLPPWRTALILLFPSLCRVGECPGPDRPEPGQAASPPSWQPPAAALPTLHQGAAHPHPAGAAGAGGDTGRTEGGKGGPLSTWVAALMALVSHRCLVTPWWTLLHSSSVPARSLQSPVMLARPWMSVGQCVPQNPVVTGPAWSL